MASTRPRNPRPNDRGSRSPRPRRDGNISTSTILMFAAFAGTVTWQAIPFIQNASLSPDQRREIETSVYYDGCREVRAMGKAPIYSGQPGYRAGMDRDGDGIACEPYR